MNHKETKLGVIYAISAYVMWGIAPIYFKAITQVPPVEILCHRIIWSLLFLFILSIFYKNWRKVREIIKNPRKTSLLFLTSTLIGINWLIFIWAVANEKMLDASLGYYINPLINVILGMLFLGERLRKLQWFAVLLATISVGFQVLKLGTFPWLALSLACSFGFYGLFRKKLQVNAQVGLLLETLVLSPLAGYFLFFVANTPTAQFSDNTLKLNILLLSAGIVTTLPLLCFTAAATRLKLSTLGFLQYIGPSLMFLLALFYGEQFSIEKAITFSLIWLALFIFTYDGLKAAKAIKKRD